MSDAGHDERAGKSARTRETIILALFELVREGNFHPRGEEIAAKADVSIRTLFRHFDDMESLFQIAQNIVSERMEGDLPLPTLAGNFMARCRAYTTAQTEIYEDARNYLVFYAMRTKTAAELDAGQAVNGKRLRLRLWSALPECAAVHPPLRQAVEQLFSFEAWAQFRFEQCLSSEDTIETICQTAQTLMKAGTPSIEQSLGQTKPNDS